MPTNASSCCQSIGNKDVFAILERSAQISIRALGKDSRGKCVYNVMESDCCVFSTLHVTECEETMELKDSCGKVIQTAKGGLTKSEDMMLVSGYNKCGTLVKIAEIYHTAISLFFNDKRDDTTRLTIKHPPEHLHCDEAKISFTNINDKVVADLSRKNCSVTLSFGLPIGTGICRSLILLYALKAYYIIYKMHQYPMPQNILSEMAPSRPCSAGLGMLKVISRFTLRSACRDGKQCRYTELMDSCSGIIKMVIEEDVKANSVVFRNEFGNLQFYSSLGQDKDTVGVFADTGKPLGMFYKNGRDYSVVDTALDKEVFTVKRRDFGQISFVVEKADCTCRTVARIFSQDYCIIVEISDSEMGPQQRAILLAFAQNQALLLYRNGESCPPMVEMYSYRKSFL